MNYNRIILVGRLTRDPDLRTTPDGVSVVRFAIAVNRTGRPSAEDQADFFDVVAFRQLADTVANYMTKGKLVLVEGKLQTRSYTDREGNRRKAFEVVADTVRFLERVREGDPVSGTAYGAESEDFPPSAAPAASAAPRPVQRPAGAPIPPPSRREEPEPIDPYDEIEFDDSEMDDPFR
ncbi:MAG: single-stranded DNA-binding protein [Fimbriimonadales bacterium]